MHDGYECLQNNVSCMTEKRQLILLGISDGLIVKPLSQIYCLCDKCPNDYPSSTPIEGVALLRFLMCRSLRRGRFEVPTTRHERRQGKQGRMSL